MSQSHQRQRSIVTTFAVYKCSPALSHNSAPRCHRIWRDPSLRPDEGRDRRHKTQKQQQSFPSVLPCRLMAVGGGAASVGNMRNLRTATTNCPSLTSKGSRTDGCCPLRQLRHVQYRTDFMDKVCLHNALCGSSATTSRTDPANLPQLPPNSPSNMP